LYARIVVHNCRTQLSIQNSNLQMNIIAEVLAIGGVRGRLARKNDSDVSCYMSSKM